MRNCMNDEYWNKTGCCRRCGHIPCCCQCHIKCTAAASPFNPTQAAGYQPGQTVIMPDGTIYIVNKLNPSGVPGSSPDYTPVAGGGASSSVFDPSKSGAYKQGELIVYNGAIYVVGKDNPSGVPGSSPDYSPLTGGLPEFNPANTGGYQPGQLITDNGVSYIGQKANPTGVPGSSPDYSPLTGGLPEFNPANTGGY
ncbi:MAG: hypothetical protein LBU86_04950, partial [Oscillospiraceae bacterium]|nr:hypothetical protein [Oscillospiraceae bacterium]